LIQIAVLQQDLLENDVDEARKERGRKDPENIRPVHGWHAEERRRLYGHHARLMELGGAQSRRSIYSSSATSG